MKKIGNNRSNQLLNPQNKRPHPPVDADEADSVMERFIRQKYADVQRRTSRTNAMSDEDDSPPPLPPKSPPGGARISLRSASNIFPLSSRAKRDAAAAAGRAEGAAAPPHGVSTSRHANKPSQVFGATVEYDAGDEADRKLAKLRSMGFGDTQRNAMVLKGVGGNLERAIETLIRLGEGDVKPGALPSPAPVTSPTDQALRNSRSLTPVSSTGGAAGPGQARTLSRDGPATPSTASTNPFDMLPPQPQSAQSTGTMQYNKNPYSVPHHMSEQNLINQAFNNLSLATPSLPLFPNHTGGFPAQQLSPQHQYQQSMTPPVSSQAFMSPFGGSQQQLYQQQWQYHPQPLQPQHTGNPFWNHQAQGLGLQSMAPQQQFQQPQQALVVSTTGGSSNNPFARSPTRIQSPSTLGQIPEQAQAAFYNQPQYQQQQQQHQQQHQQQQAQLVNSNNPFAPQQPQPQMYAPPRPDKASIMALYNYPQLAPKPQPQPQQQPPNNDTAAAAAAAAQQNRSVSTPLSPSKNPFAAATVGSPTATTNGAGPADAGAPKHQPTRDSVAMGLEMAWSNGRHSPDAFASLSSRHR